LGRTEEFKALGYKLFDEFLIKGNKLLKEGIGKEFEDLKTNLASCISLYSETSFLGTKAIPIKEFEKLINTTQSSVKGIYNYYLEKERKIEIKKNDYHTYNQFSHEFRTIQEFMNALSNFEIFIKSSSCKLANNPFLIIDGEAGIGKSHLIGDVVTSRIERNYDSIFLLGQHFVTDENPWIQILKMLQIKSDTSKFLQKLNLRAEETGKRIIIFIDAINEGHGIYFWHDSITSFINEIQKYQWLGIVFSVRSSYKDIILSKSMISNLNIEEYSHTGFKNIEFDACKLFFDNYKIELPKVPLLNPEFQNPLFLKLFCEGINKAGLTSIPDGLQGITSIINFFIDNVDKVLSSPWKINYSKSLHLVKMAINAFIKYKVDNQLIYVPYLKASKIIDEAISSFINKKGFIEEMIREGVFSKNIFYTNDGNNSEEGIYLVYERFEDHLTVQYLINKYPNLKDEFKINGNLHCYVQDENSMYLNKGLIEAFSIQIPEKYGYEFYTIIPNFKNKYPIIESYIESLLWRKIDTIDKGSIDYINKYVLPNNDYQDMFWETIIAITGIPNHYFNAFFLHGYLMKFSLAERDANWTKLLKNKYIDNSSVKRLIEWAWKNTDKFHLSNESVLLSGITIAWFHTSSNRELRDSATKALVCLLQNRIDVLLEILQMFEKVNDLYVYERLFAVAYGCVLRTKEKGKIAKLSEYIYKTIFNNTNGVIPHILLRDYARGVIEYAHYIGNDLSFDISKVRPPYKSTWPDNIPTETELSKKYNTDNYEYRILWSSVMGFGDFSRYIIGTNTTSTEWSSCRKGEIPIDSDNFFDLRIAQRFIFSKIIELGWKPKLHLSFDKEVNTERNNNYFSNERIGKKYQWLAFYQYMALLSDNFIKKKKWGNQEETPYQGPWDPNVRDIDPTILINKTSDYDEKQPHDFWWEKKQKFNWECTNDEWIKDLTNIPNMSELIQIKDENNEEWLILEGYPLWNEPKQIGYEKYDQPQKQLWCQIKSYLVKNNEANQFKDWAIKNNNVSYFMPENNGNNYIFSKEFYWSPAQEYINSDLYENSEWKNAYDRENERYLFNLNVTAQKFVWEMEYGKSRIETTSLLKPSNIIYQGMELINGENDGEFIDLSTELQCFDPSIYCNSRSYLIIRKNPFVKFLEKNNLKIIWITREEKEIIGGQNFHSKVFNRLEISGTYFFENNNLTGEINTVNR
jgi:hypothetical protein